MKNCVLLVSGAPDGQNSYELVLEPGTTPRDIKARVGLPPDYLLSREGSGVFFADTQSVYGDISEGGKIRATAPATVG